MKKEIVLRALKEADFIVKNNSTVREVAKVFGVSKSTVHFDLKFRLFGVDKNMFKRVRKVLENNLEQRHIRGGIATREKYKKLKK